tara:strand:- start:165 stop:590 length:426 start_codon:yes stop_codon:yes gene_type:complete
MIKYKLECKNCKIFFDSWFASSKEFEKLKKRNLINCHTCNSIKVEKTLMAPKVLSKNSNNNENNFQKYKNINKKLREYQRFIKNNFKYVGDNFAYEARSIHYNNKKNQKGIFGTASNDQIKELKEEGINTEVIPWIEDKNN